MFDHAGRARSRWVAWATLAILLAGCPPRMTDVQKHIKDAADLFDGGNYPRALEEYDRALELAPNAPGVLVNRGNTKMMLDDLEGALADYAAALELDPRLAKAYANRGILHDRGGDRSAAMADYRNALELDPELGSPPGLLDQILYARPTETIRDRLDYLEALEKGRAPAPAPPR